MFLGYVFAGLSLRMLSWYPHLYIVPATSEESLCVDALSSESCDRTLNPPEAVTSESRVVISTKHLIISSHCLVAKVAVDSGPR